MNRFNVSFAPVSLLPLPTTIITVRAVDRKDAEKVAVEVLRMQGHEPKLIGVRVAR